MPAKRDGVILVHPRKSRRPPEPRPNGSCTDGGRLSCEGQDFGDKSLPRRWPTLPTVWCSSALSLEHNARVGEVSPECADQQHVRIGRRISPLAPPTLRPTILKQRRADQWDSAPWVCAIEGCFWNMLVIHENAARSNAPGLEGAMERDRAFFRRHPFLSAYTREIMRGEFPQSIFPVPPGYQLEGSIRVERISATMRKRVVLIAMIVAECE